MQCALAHRCTLIHTHVSRVPLARPQGWRALGFHKKPVKSTDGEHTQYARFFFVFFCFCAAAGAGGGGAAGFHMMTSNAIADSLACDQFIQDMTGFALNLYRLIVE
jgi:hypothetical protein